MIRVNLRRQPTVENRRRLAANVKRIREARGYTQNGLAKVSGLNEKYISNVEQATVNIILASLEALARDLSCTEEELLRRARP